MTKHIFIVAGEASGDMHAANLVKSLQQQNSNLRFSGMGAAKMRAAGVEIVQDSTRLGYVGLFEIIKHLPIIFSTFKKLRNALDKDRPDLVILVDYPGFNLRFAKMAKKRNCKVLYYISPQLWAWHQSRVKIIKRYVDEMAVLFPFEVDFYRRFGVDAKFVGNPLTKHVKPTKTTTEIQNEFAIDPTLPLISLLPGSRHSEIAKLLPIIIASAHLLKQWRPELQFILPVAPTLKLEDIAPYLQKANYVKLVFGHTYDVISICTAAIVTSGTATLETALLGTPMVIVYKLAWLTAKLARIVMKVPYLGMCNIIAGKEVAKEFLQEHAKPELIAAEIKRLLTNENYYNERKTELQNIKVNLATDQAENIANIVLRLLKTPSF